MLLRECTSQAQDFKSKAWGMTLRGGVWHEPKLLDQVSPKILARARGLQEEEFYILGKVSLFLISTLRIILPLFFGQKFVG